MNGSMGLRMMYRAPCSLPVMLLLTGITLTTQAQTSTELDAVLEGFDDPQPSSEIDAVLEGFESTDGAQLETILDGFDSTAAETSATSPPPPSYLSGSLGLSTTYNYAHSAPAPGETDYRGLSRLRAKLNLEYDRRFHDDWRINLTGYGYYDAAYSLNGRDDYTQEVLDEYESELELGEIYLQGRLARQIDLTVGRQIVVWGKSDTLRVTDILNPLDNREAGLVDIEDLRLPLTMAKLDYFMGDWGFSAIAIPEIRFHKIPPPGSDFHAMPPGPAPARENIPSDGGDNTEYAFAANGIFSGWDLSLYWAQYYDDQPYTLPVNDMPSVQHHARLTLGGIAANIAVGNWLLKGELAQTRGIRYNPEPNSDKTHSQLLTGIEYSGITDTTLSWESALRHLHEYTIPIEDNGIRENNLSTAVRYTGDFLRTRLQLTAVAAIYGSSLGDGGFTRLSARYDLIDALSLTGGIVTYQHSNTIPFNTVADNDRLFIDLKYSF